MEKVYSRDGTLIALDRAGDGPPIVLVDGALCYRKLGPSGPLAARLQEHFTVFTYDRRGRGDSGDTAPYNVARELEDLDAVIQAAGGSAFVYGISSGAALALEGANRGLAIKKLALYEAPFIVDDTHPPIADDFLTRLKALIAANRRGEAVALFMKQVGLPRIFIALMRLMPAWRKLKGIAHTLVYDMTIVEGNQRGKPLPPSRWASVTMPTLVADGGKSPVWMRHAMRSLADVLPNSEYLTIEGQTHMLSPKAIAPLLVEFYKGSKGLVG